MMPILHCYSGVEYNKSLHFHEKQNIILPVINFKTTTEFHTKTLEIVIDTIDNLSYHQQRPWKSMLKNCFESCIHR